MTLVDVTKVRGWNFNKKRDIHFLKKYSAPGNTFKSVSIVFYRSRFFIY